MFFYFLKTIDKQFKKIYLLDIIRNKEIFHEKIIFTSFNGGGVLLALLACQGGNSTTTSQTKNATRASYFTQTADINLAKQIHDDTMLAFLDNDTIKNLIITKIANKEETFSVLDFNLIKGEMVKQMVSTNLTTTQKEEYFEAMWNQAYTFENGEYVHKRISEFNSAVQNACEAPNSIVCEDLIYLNNQLILVDSRYADGIIKKEPIDSIISGCLAIINNMQSHSFETQEGALAAAHTIGVAQSSYGLHHKRSNVYKQVTGENYVYTVNSSAREGFDYGGAVLSSALVGAISGNLTAAGNAVASGVNAGIATSWLSACYDLGDWIGRQTRGWFY